VVEYWGGVSLLVMSITDQNCHVVLFLPQPPLAHTSPELVGGSMASSNVCLSGAADCFSLATITYQLVVGQQLLPVGSSTGEYRSRMSNAGCWDMSGISGSLQVGGRGQMCQLQSPAAVMQLTDLTAGCCSVVVLHCHEVQCGGAALPGSAMFAQCVAAVSLEDFTMWQWCKWNRGGLLLMSFT
jgi:hypothetical protein